MKATTREDLNLKEDETMCERCVHENICRREQCGEPYVVIRSCFDFEKKRPHGKWIKQFDVKTQYYTCTCSVCGDTHRLLINYFLGSNFCPNCGSDMREGEKE